MTEQEIIDGNKLIALFMGYKEDEIQAEEWCGCNVLDEVFLGHKEMCPANYHENWSRLMPVVEKMHSDSDVWVTIMYNCCKIHWATPNQHEPILIDEKPTIEAVWLAVTECIKFLNQQPK